MRFAESELRQITEETWRALLGENLQHRLGPLSPWKMTEPVAVSLQIVGDWRLGVIIFCPVALARRAAAIMFQLDEQAVTECEIEDVLRELISIIAGNIKGILSGSNCISFPEIDQGNAFERRFPHYMLLSEASFTFGSQPLQVQVLCEDVVAQSPNATVNAKSRRQ